MPYGSGDLAWLPCLYTRDFSQVVPFPRSVVYSIGSICAAMQSRRPDSEDMSRSWHDKAVSLCTSQSSRFLEPLCIHCGITNQLPSEESNSPSRWRKDESGREWPHPCACSASIRSTSILSASIRSTLLLQPRASRRRQVLRDTPGAGTIVGVDNIYQ